jgi:hypothetical protein
VYVPPLQFPPAVLAPTGQGSEPPRTRRANPPPGAPRTVVPAPTEQGRVPVGGGHVKPPLGRNYRRED